MAHVSSCFAIGCSCEDFFDVRDVNESHVHEVIQTILSDWEKYSTSLKYAVRYCEVALEMKEHVLKIQCLYILNNITNWRHPNAPYIRRVLKAFAKKENK
jgi:hypothetical protein